MINPNLEKKKSIKRFFWAFLIGSILVLLHNLAYIFNITIPTINPILNSWYVLFPLLIFFIYFGHKQLLKLKNDKGYSKFYLMIILTSVLFVPNLFLSAQNTHFFVHNCGGGRVVVVFPDYPMQALGVNYYHIYTNAFLPVNIPNIKASYYREGVEVNVTKISERLNEVKNDPENTLFANGERFSHLPFLYQGIIDNCF